VRRNLVAFLGTLSSLVLLFAYPTSHNATTSTTSGSSAGTGSAGSSGSSSGSSSAGTSGSSSGSSSGSQSYTGSAVTTRWGVVQVQITVQNGKITAAEAVQYPNGNPRDQQINAYALPILAQEAVAAQNAKIDTVGGATVTSDGYLQSLQSAVDAAHL
jgi:uncharacterized protein with FMN-binding domain